MECIFLHVWGHSQPKGESIVVSSSHVGVRPPLTSPQRHHVNREERGMFETNRIREERARKTVRELAFRLGFRITLSQTVPGWHCPLSSREFSTQLEERDTAALIHSGTRRRLLAVTGYMLLHAITWVSMFVLTRNQPANSRTSSSEEHRFGNSKSRRFAWTSEN